MCKSTIYWSLLLFQLIYQLGVVLNLTVCLRMVLFPMTRSILCPRWNQAVHYRELCITDSAADCLRGRHFRNELKLPLNNSFPFLKNRVLSITMSQHCLSPWSRLAKRSVCARLLKTEARSDTCNAFPNSNRASSSSPFSVRRTACSSSSLDACKSFVSGSLSTSSSSAWIATVWEVTPLSSSGLNTDSNTCWSWGLSLRLSCGMSRISETDAIASNSRINWDKGANHMWFHIQFESKQYVKQVA